MYLELGFCFHDSHLQEVDADEIVMLTSFEYFLASTAARTSVLLTEYKKQKLPGGLFTFRFQMFLQILIINNGLNKFYSFTKEFQTWQSSAVHLNITVFSFFKKNPEGFTSSKILQS